MVPFPYNENSVNIDIIISVRGNFLYSSFRYLHFDRASFLDIVDLMVKVFRSGETDVDFHRLKISKQ